MNRSADIARRLLPWWPALVVVGVGMAILWPIPTGVMPLSADHTVHLTRAWMYGQALADGELRAWTPIWFFGTPVGELYPVLGDVLIAAVRVLGFGLLDWPQAYALAFTIVFVTQGLVLLRAGNMMGWGPVPGLVAALLVMADVGSYREGGWIYVVFYGVWPQTLATSLTWLGFAELADGMRTRDVGVLRRRLVGASVALGASLLAHPISLATVAVGGPICVLAMGGLDRDRLQRAAATGIGVIVVALMLAAWWLLPMLGHRAWMASYGWLWLPLPTMVDQVLAGQWCQSMPASVGHTISAGLLAVAVLGRRTARFYGATALILWVLASRDLAWALRLDLISEGFTHLQYQRFITAAKPGLFLMAGAAVGGAAHAARHAWRSFSARRGRPAAGALGLAAIVVGGMMARDLRAEFVKLDPDIGDVQTDRVPGLEEIDAEYAELADWLRQRWTDRDRFWRVTVRGARNVHWFMDLPVFAEGVPILKQGFTPGDNFVHKPERAPPQLQALAQVRYEIRHGQRHPRNTAATFGSVFVTQRRDWEADHGVGLEGPGHVEVVEGFVGGDEVVVRVSGTEGPTRLVFGVGGFPRWTLEGKNGPIPWVEAPAVGDGPVATPDERRAGVLRGGKAHGDDGTEPTLIAADVTDGEYTLRYEAWRGRDLLGLLCSAIAAGLCVSLLGWPTRVAMPGLWVERSRRRLGRFGHPAVLGTLALGVVFLAAGRYERGRAAEVSLAAGWVQRGQARRSHARADYLKTDMLIRPAIVFDRRHRDPAVVGFEGAVLGRTLDGWVALDDDDAKLDAAGQVQLRIEARPSGTDDPWERLFDERLRHRPGLVDLSIPTQAFTGKRVDLRVTAIAEGRRLPEVGFDLELGLPPTGGPR